jgi:CRISPR/Cas system CSM-associated protein Csm2 small subunit
MFMIVIINVWLVVIQRIDMIYLRGSLRKQINKMSSKEQKAKKAESKLRDYIQKKYGKIDLGFVSEGVSDAWLRRFYETISKRRIPKEKH